MSVANAPPEAAALTTEGPPPATIAANAASGEPSLASTSSNTLGDSNADVSSVSSVTEVIFNADNKLAPVTKSSCDRGRHNADDHTDDADADSDDIDDHDDEPVSVLDMLWTWYLPLLLLWFRRSMFGTANLLRSVVIGQCIRLLLTTATGTVDPLPKWALMVSDPHAWPPPALTVLAILTIVALVVHPDGLTWFMLGKLRYVKRRLTPSAACCTRQALSFLIFVSLTFH